MAFRKVECKKFRQSLACYYQCGNEDFVMRKRVWFLSLLLMFLTVLALRRNESSHFIPQFKVLALRRILPYVEAGQQGQDCALKYEMEIPRKRLGQFTF